MKIRKMKRCILVGYSVGGGVGVGEIKERFAGMREDVCLRNVVVCEAAREFPPGILTRLTRAIRIPAENYNYNYLSTRGRSFHKV